MFHSSVRHLSWFLAVVISASIAYPAHAQNKMSAMQLAVANKSNLPTVRALEAAAEILRYNAMIIADMKTRADLKINLDIPEINWSTMGHPICPSNDDSLACCVISKCHIGMPMGDCGQICKPKLESIATTSKPRGTTKEYCKRLYSQYKSAKDSGNFIISIQLGRRLVQSGCVRQHQLVINRMR